MPPSGAVLLLHGVGSNESDLLGLADGLADDVLIASLRAPLPLSPTQFAWFAVRFTPQGPQIEAAQAEASRQALIGF
ncbi:MAG: phospholipase, partial [Paludibacterium sp.]|nr:phospholipase [Paludibacterium sp.]